MMAWDQGRDAGCIPWRAQDLAPELTESPMILHTEIWYPHGGFYCDPKGWRKNTLLTLG